MRRDQNHLTSASRMPNVVRKRSKTIAELLVNRVEGDGQI